MAAVLFAALAIGARIDHTTPRLLPMLLFSSAVVGIVGLVRDTLGFDAVEWTAVAGSPHTTMYARDGGLFGNVRLLENHLSARDPDAALRGRLLRLTEGRLSQLGLRRRDPEVVARLGPTLTGVLDGPPRRLGVAEIDECIRRIEELAP
jgi:hypothetical protein